MRGGFADGRGRVGSMNAVAILTQSQPACADRIVFSGRDRALRTIPGGIGDPVDDHKFPLGRWRGRFADRDVIEFQNLATLDDGELAFGYRNDNLNGFRFACLRRVLNYIAHNAAGRDCLTTPRDRVPRCALFRDAVDGSGHHYCCQLRNLSVYRFHAREDCSCLA